MPLSRVTPLVLWLISIGYLQACRTLPSSDLGETSLLESSSLTELFRDPIALEVNLLKFKSLIPAKSSKVVVTPVLIIKNQLVADIQAATEIPIVEETKLIEDRRSTKLVISNAEMLSVLTKFESQLKSKGESSSIALTVSLVTEAKGKIALTTIPLLDVSYLKVDRYESVPRILSWGSGKGESIALVESGKEAQNPILTVVYQSRIVWSDQAGSIFPYSDLKVDDAAILRPDNARVPSIKLQLQNHNLQKGMRINFDVGLQKIDSKRTNQLGEGVALTSNRISSVAAISLNTKAFAALKAAIDDDVNINVDVYKTFLLDRSLYCSVKLIAVNLRQSLIHTLPCGESRISFTVDEGR